MENNEYLKGLATVWPEDTDQSPQTVYFEPPRKRKYDIKWLLLWQDESDIGVSIREQAIMEKPLTQTEYRVRDILLATIGIGNMVYINQSQIARDLRLTRANVCNAIKRLISLQIVISGPKNGKSNTYMINPAFCFNGGLGNGIKQRKETIQQQRQAKITEFKQGRLLSN